MLNRCSRTIKLSLWRKMKNKSVNKHNDHIKDVDNIFFQMKFNFRPVYGI